MSSAAKEKKPGVLSRVGRSFMNMRGEMARVVWPSRKQVFNNTIIVLSFMSLSAIIIGGFDTLLAWLTKLAFGIGA